MSLSTQVQFGNLGKQSDHLEFWKSVWNSPTLTPPPTPTPPMAPVLRPLAPPVPSLTLPVPLRTIQVHNRHRRYPYEELMQFAELLAAKWANDLHAKVNTTPGITVAFQNVKTYFDTFLDAW